MKYYGKESLASFLKIVLDVLLFIGIALFIWVCISNLSENYSNNNISIYQKIIIGILFLIGSFSIFVIVYNLRNIMDSIVEVNPFIRRNVKSLRNISICCFIIAICYIINFFINIKHGKYHFIFIDRAGIHTDMEFLIFFFAGCFILILSKVFKQAVEVKEENDLTI